MYGNAGFALLLMWAGVLTAQTCETTESVAVHIVPPVAKQRILPDTKKIHGIVNGKLFAVLAHKEYHDVSFVLTPGKTLENVLIVPSELKSATGGVIPASAADVYAVACWYQDAGMGYQEQIPPHNYDPSFRSGVRIMVPELLLKDLSLIRVDTEKKENYIRVDENGTSRYEWISSTKVGDGLTGAKIVPTGDRKVLQPHTVPGGRNQQYYITIRVPDETEPGLYHGTVRILSGNVTVKEIPLFVRVLPFELEKGHEVAQSICDDWYMGGRIDCAKMLELYRNVVETRKRYGFRTAGICGGQQSLIRSRKVRIEDFLKIQKEAGYDFENDIVHISFSDSNAEQILLPGGEERIRALAETAWKYGIRKLEIYSVDEALSNNFDMKKLHEAMDRVHKLGLGIRVHGCGIPAGHQKDWRAPGNFGFLGDVQDHFTCWGYPNRDEAGKWHAAGHLISCYSNPMGGVEQPDAYRRNYGLLLWQYNYDGASNYSELYRWGDFFTRGYKRMNMFYPTMEGLLTTVQANGMREGFDDVRYVKTLEKLLREGASGKKEDVEKWVQWMKQGDINRDVPDSNMLRADMIRMCLTLLNQGK